MNKSLPTQYRNKRYVARRLCINGVERGLSFVKIEDWKVNVEDFTVETHSTVSVDSLAVTTDARNLLLTIEIN